ncbi:hypothetical protein ZONE111904_02395 [Zobellia nedashkovskayae]
MINAIFLQKNALITKNCTNILLGCKFSITLSTLDKSGAMFKMEM